MATKTYKVVGIGGKYSIYVRYEKTGKQVQFNRHFSDLTYTTDDEDLQKGIESTNEFKRGIIVIESVIGKQEPVKQEPAGGKQKPVKQEPAGGNDDGAGGTGEEIVEGPTTVQEAKEWLKTNKGVHHVALNSLEKVKMQAEKSGVVFPNVVWPE